MAQQRESNIYILLMGKRHFSLWGGQMRLTAHQGWSHLGTLTEMSLAHFIETEMLPKMEANGGSLLIKSFSESF